MLIGSRIIRRYCILTQDQRYNLLHIFPALAFSTEGGLHCANRLTPEEDEQKFEPKIHEDFCFMRDSSLAALIKILEAFGMC